MSNSYEIYEVHPQDLGKLKDLLEKKFPDSLTVHGFLDVYLRYGPFKEIRVKFYCAISEEFKSFCCSAITSSQKGISNLAVYWDTEEIEESQVAKLFSTFKQWNWNEPFVLLVSSFKLKVMFDSLIEKRMIPTNLILSDMTGVHSQEAFILSLCKEDFKEPIVPDGYEIKYLASSFSSHILSRWNFSYTETQEAVQERLSILKGIGAFRVNSQSSVNYDEDNRNVSSLVSWSLQYFSGAIGMTFTIPIERGKGLAGAVTLTLAKTILDEGRIPFCFIESTNILSLKLHQKLGFKIVGSSGISLFIQGNV